MDTIEIVILTSSCIINIAVIVMSAFALNRSNNVAIELEAMKRSTHNIQYVPVDSSWDKEEQDLNKAFSESVEQNQDTSGLRKVNSIYEPIE